MPALRARYFPLVRVAWAALKGSIYPRQHISVCPRKRRRDQQPGEVPHASRAAGIWQLLSLPRPGSGSKCSRTCTLQQATGADAGRDIHNDCCCSCPRGMQWANRDMLSGKRESFPTTDV